MTRGLSQTLGFVAAAALLAVLVPTGAEAYVYLAPSHCPNGATWNQNDLPTDYYLNEQGSDDISDFSELERVVRASFRSWESPCCSTFRVNYAGKSSKTALDDDSTSRGEIVLSWREENWPSQLGHPSKTLAFSNPRFQGCEITSGTTLFNGTAHTFSTSSTGGTYDLEDVATHEIGHLAGLGHSSHQQATMSASYHTSMDELETDDKEGLCSLHGGGTCSCDDNSACFGTEHCVDGTCQKAPCDSDADCSGPKHCDTDSGQCIVPSCTDDDDCRSDYRCNRDGKCVTECTICQTCGSRSDCGANAVCATIDGSGHCVTQCDTDENCPGTSKCFTVSGQWGSRHNLCLNPGAKSGDPDDVCPESYVCSFDGQSSGDAGTGDTDVGDVGLSDAGSSTDETPNAPASNCPSLGTTCSNTDHSQCGSDADGCMLLADGNQICTCSCEMDSDCGTDNSCVQVAPGSSWCFPNDSGDEADASSHCDNITCDRHQTCRDGRCVSDADGSADGDEASEIVVIETDQSEGGCSQAGDSPVPGPVAWIVGLLAWVGWRRST